MPRPTKDLTNQQIGRWKVSKVVTHRDKRGRPYWLCECDCGTKRPVASWHLAEGKTQSCGCLARETLIARNWKHGGRHTPEYRTWDAMIDRCENPNNSRYADWGGRGIKIHPEWRSDFSAFFAYIGKKPSRKHSIDRIDNDRGYEPGNVRWATKRQQNLNRRPRRKSPTNLGQDAPSPR